MEKTRCRICNSANITSCGELKPYNDLNPFEIFDCQDCKCRFTFREESMFDKMHSSPNSTYSFHDKRAAFIKKLFDQKNTRKIKKSLIATHNFKFIIDIIPEETKSLKLLEIGCSSGYLTAYFISKGYNIIGSDISKSAVEKAKNLFGNHFEIIDNNFYDKYLNNFDYIFHSGTIGCVDDPREFIYKCLKMLKPNGLLLFNAPDVLSAKEMNAVWINSTFPPDLITLFDESFWKKSFTNNAEIKINYNPYNHRNNTKKIILKFLKKSYLSIKTTNLLNHTEKYYLLKKIAQSIYLSTIVPLFTFLVNCKLLPKYKNEFGMYLSFKKK